MVELCFTDYKFTDYLGQTWYACIHRTKKGIYYLVDGNLKKGGKDESTKYDIKQGQ